MAEDDVQRPDPDPRRTPEIDAVFGRLKSAAFHELVDRARRGDRTAQETLIAWIQPALVRYCRARIGRGGSGFATADDVAQEIMIGVLQALPRFTDESRFFMAFVYGIAKNKVADHYRRVARDPKEQADLPDTADPAPGPEQQVLRRELSRRMIALLHTLPAREREILTMRVVLGLSARDVGVAMNLSPTAVRVAQHRALAKLRGRLKGSDWL